MRKIQFEKKIYERLENMDRDIQNLVKAHYRVMSMLVPEARPTKREIEIFKLRRRERVVPLEKIEKRLKNV